MPHTVTSADGTSIAYDREGEGDAVVLVSAAMNLRASGAELAHALAGRGFVVVSYDRRARGDSDDAAPLAEWDPDRETEDLAAVLDLVGGRAAVVGSSSGGAVALHAAVAGLGISHLALWEIPLDLGPGDGGAELARLRDLVLAGDDAGAVEYFMRDLPPQWLAGAKASPYWAAMTAMAPSLGYDSVALSWTQSAPLGELLGGVDAPTLVLMGEETQPIFPAAADALVAAMPDARQRRISGANHGWDTTAMASAVEALLRS